MTLATMPNVLDRVPIAKVKLLSGSNHAIVGTAFAVARDTAITASHVITHKKAEVQFNDAELRLIFRDDYERTAELLDQDQLSDIAILRICRSLGKRTFVFPWFCLPDERLSEREDFQAPGYPVATMGDVQIVSGKIEPLGTLTQAGSKKTKGNSSEVLQLDCPQAYRSNLKKLSGAPVLLCRSNEALPLVGLIRRQLKDRDSNRPAGVAYATPWNVLAERLNAALKMSLEGLGFAPAEHTRHVQITISVVTSPSSGGNRVRQTRVVEADVVVVINLPSPRQFAHKSSIFRPDRSHIDIRPTTKPSRHTPKGD